MLNIKIFNSNELFIFEIKVQKTRHEFLYKSVHVQKRIIKAKKRGKSAKKMIEEEHDSVTFSDIEPDTQVDPRSLVKALTDLQTSQQSKPAKSGPNRQEQSLEFRCKAKIINKQLIFVKNHVKIFKFNIKRIFLEHFGFKCMIFVKNDENEQNILVMEVTAPPQDISNFVQMVETTNRHKARRFPLATMFDSKISESPLTQKSGAVDLKGFLNHFLFFSLINFIWVVSDGNQTSLRVFMENWKLFVDGFSVLELMIITLHFTLTLVIGYSLQFFAFKKTISEFYIALAVILHLTIFFVYSSWLVYVLNFSILLNLIINFIIIVILLKSISLAHVCFSIRRILFHIYKHGKKHYAFEKLFQENRISKNNFLIILKNQRSPWNLIPIRHFLFFLFIPSLNFKLRYASRKINKTLVLKKLIELPLLCLLFLSFFVYFVLPLIHSSDSMFLGSSPIFYKILYFLKLATACTISWILLFICMFHGYCEFVSELLGLTDRHFYHDWWNSLNLSQYWQLWNLALHRFLVCHVSHPLISLRVNHHVSDALVYIISTVCYQYIVSLALKRFCILTLFMNLIQYLYFYFESAAQIYLKLEKSVFGNYIFWIMLCFFGQPSLLLQQYFYFKYKNYFFELFTLDKLTTIFTL